MDIDLLINGYYWIYYWIYQLIDIDLLTTINHHRFNTPKNYEFVSWDYYSQYMENYIRNHQPVINIIIFPIFTSWYSTKKTTLGRHTQFQPQPHPGPKQKLFVYTSRMVICKHVRASVAASCRQHVWSFRMIKNQEVGDSQRQCG